MPLNKCTICSSPLYNQEDTGADSIRYKCYQCGEYTITDTAYASFPEHINSDYKKSSLSGWIRRNQGFTITTTNSEMLENISKPNIPDRALSLLKYISMRLPDIGQTFSINNALRTVELFQRPETDVLTQEDKLNGEFVMPMVSESWSKNRNELNYLINEYLINSRKYLKIGTANDVSITPSGWIQLENTINVQSDIVFIASKYEETINTFLDSYVVTAIKNAGYTPKLMRSHDHVNVIDNEMLSLIRQSKFVIADLTNNSRGAYYEAGFAHGMGLPVIFTCEKTYYEDEDNAIHFDTSHYPIKTWLNDNEENAEKYSNELKHFIEANFPR